MKDIKEIKSSEPESLPDLELKANLNPQQRAYLAVLKDKMKKILRNKTKQELAKAGDLPALKNYRAVLSEILEFLQTKEMKNIKGANDKILWDWEVGEMEVVDLDKFEKKYGKDKYDKPIFTEDGENYFFQVQIGDNWKLLNRHGEIKCEAFNNGKFDDIIISPGGISFAAIKKNIIPGSEFSQVKVNVNGQLWKTPVLFDRDTSLPNTYHFSPDGSSFTVVSEEGSAAQRLVENDEPVDGIKKDRLVRNFTFCPDGTKKAFVLVNTASGSAQDIVIDGDKEWTRIIGPCNYPVYSLDGSKLAVVMFGEWIIVNDEAITRPASTKKILGQPVFSPDGSKLAYITENSTHEGQVLAENDKIKWPIGFKNIIKNSLVYSPDGNNIALVASSANINYNVIIINNSNLGESWESVINLTFSPDNKKIMFVGLKGKKYYRVVRDVSEFIK